MKAMKAVAGKVNTYRSGDRKTMQNFRTASGPAKRIRK